MTILIHHRNTNQKNYQKHHLATYQRYIYHFEQDTLTRCLYFKRYNNQNTDVIISPILSNSIYNALRKNCHGYDWIKKLSASNIQLSTNKIR